MTTRRRMLRDLAAGVAGLAVWPKAGRAQGAESVEPADTTHSEVPDTTQTHTAVSIPLSTAKNLAKVGGSAVVTVNGRTLLLARDSDTTVVALESRCTHKQVTVKYDHKNRRLNCPGHGSRFDLDGTVLRGPAGHALPTYQAVLGEDAVVVLLPKQSSVPG